MSDTEKFASILADESESPYRRILAGDMLRYRLTKFDPVQIRTKGEPPTYAEHISEQVLELGKAFQLSAAPDEQKMKTYDAMERAYITLGRNDFHDFLIALEWRRNVKDRFYQPRMKVLKPVVDALSDMMVNDLYDIILLSSPPRIGKSSIGLLFISWCAGRQPDSPILSTSYAEKITKMFHDGITEAYGDEEYQYRQVFPRIDLVYTSAKDLTLDFRNDGRKATRKYKSITCRAIDGSLTGATEARQLLHCDDLVRDIEEALNPNRLLTLRDKLRTNLYSRKKEGCKELHIGTRWSMHDPIGWVEAKEEGNPRCLTIRLPALDPDTDESNFDYPYGVGFSTEYYRGLRKNEDDVTWQCVYQQMPVEREGLLFPREELHFFYDLPDMKEEPPDDIFAFCDVAFGGEDFLALPIAYQWGYEPPRVVDAIFLRGGYKETEPKVAGALIKHGVRRAVFEANNGGDFYSRDISDLIKESSDHKIHIVADRAPSNKSKETRIIQHSPAIKDFVFRHPDAEGTSGMYRAFLSNLTMYTASGKNLHDDAPDSLAGLAAMMRANLNAKVTIFDRSHI